MPKPLKLAITLFVLAALGYLIYSSLHTARYRYEVCVRYGGQSSCRVAEGRTPEAAQRAAHDNACAQLTSGVTGAVTCGQTAPWKVRQLPLE